jgi:aspartyl-tRNA synthetase
MAERTRPDDHELIDSMEDAPSQSGVSGGNLQRKVAARAEDAVNPKLPTGAVELQVEELEVLSRSTPLPFQLDGEYLGDRTSVAFGCVRSALAVAAPVGPVRNSAE